MAAFEVTFEVMTERFRQRSVIEKTMKFDAETEMLAVAMAKQHTVMQNKRSFFYLKGVQPVK